MKTWSTAAFWALAAGLFVPCLDAATTRDGTAGCQAGSILVSAAELDWGKIDQPAFPDGLEIKRLHENPRINGRVGVLRFPKGYAEPRHVHTTAGHSIYVLTGRISFEGLAATSGDFIYTPPNVVHDLVALEASEILLWSDGPLDMHLSEGSAEDCPGATEISEAGDLKPSG